MNSYRPLPLALACALVASASQAETEKDLSSDKLLPVISVTADFRETEALKSSTSLTVIDAQAIARREAKHLDQLLNTAPNVNFSAGASRGRFLQVRGIGERSQFKDPLDSSVGMIIDGIDYSGLGLASTMYDVQQIEVLRGPQGTQFGSSAMAGMVNIRSNEPSQDFEGNVTAGTGNYDSHNIGVMLNGGLTDQLSARIAMYRNTSDGYIDNDYTHQDDTNNIDENTVKAQLKWQISDTLNLGFTAHYIDADNGYNAFSLENSRDIPADDPGHDRQKTKAASIQLDWTGNSIFDLKTNLFAEQSDLEYGFDWDWSNLDAIGARGEENNQRERNAYGLDMRVISKQGYEILGGAQWVAGLYVADRKVDLEYTDSWEDILYGGPWVSEFNSEFESQREAVYGQLSWDLTDTINLSTGVRFEKYQNDYNDSVDVITKQDEDLWGGKIALEYTGINNTLLYTSISRGYKIGGVNGQAVGKVLSDPSTPTNIADFLTARSTFGSETLINYEIGFKGQYFNKTLDLSLVAFYMDRKDMQANAWVLFPPTEWASYLDNVDEGNNSGIELEAHWYPSSHVNFFASLGLLHTELGDLIVQDVDTGNQLDQSGRDQAHAPAYQFNIGTQINFMENLNLTIEVDGKDSFYFSNSHNDQSDSYELLHMTLAYQWNDIALSIWGRNLTDKDYQTRGFYFDNTAPNYDGSNNQGYYQLGEPRVFGVSGSYSF